MGTERQPRPQTIESRPGYQTAPQLYKARQKWPEEDIEVSNGLRRSVSTMDDAPTVGTSTIDTASAVTRHSDSGKADFSASDTGVDGRWVCLTCTCLSSGSLLLD